MNNLNELFFSYIEHMKIRNYAKTTLIGYSRYLRQFLDWLKTSDITDIKRVTRDTLGIYQLKLMEVKANGDNTLATVSLKIRAVKRFFEYLESSNKLLINPAEHIKEPQKESRLPRAILTEDEVRKILDVPNLSTMTGIRNRTVLEVFYSTGIRLAELINLTIYDCDIQGGLLRVTGKFSKDRVVPLGKQAAKYLKKYISHVRPSHMKRNKTVRNLFVSQFGKPLSSQTIERMISSCAKKAAIDKHITPHVFRHTFATQLVKNGADIRAVQKMLGHSQLSVTRIYTRVAGVEVKKTHKESHPREKDTSERDEEPDIQGFYYAKPD